MSSSDQAPPVSMTLRFQDALWEGVSSGRVSDGFILGFISGQLEKVHLGCCPAAVIRFPFEGETAQRLLDAVNELCKIYEIAPIWVPAKNGDPATREFWFCRDQDRRWVMRLVSQIKDEEEGEKAAVQAGDTDADGNSRVPYNHHVLRGILCGIPYNQLDPRWDPDRSGEL